VSDTEVTTQPAKGWVALSAADRHLLVQAPGTAADDLQGPLDAGLVEVLQALGRDGLAALPDFALVDTSGDVARVLVRGAAFVRADGSEVPSQGRMPWRDCDLDVAAIELGDGARGGWRRPTRLGRPTPVAVTAVTPAEPAPVVEDDREQAPGPQPEAGPEPEPEPSSTDPEPEPTEPAPPVPPVDLTLPPDEEHAGSAPAERVAPAEPAAPQKKVLIDSVPWRTLPEGEAAAAPPPPAPVPAPEVAPVPAVAPTPADEPPPPQPTEVLDAVESASTGPDNWGMTGPQPAAQQPAPVPDVTMDRGALTPGTEGPPDSPVVLAVLCPAGHHSSPHASACRVCGRDIPTQQPFQTPRPQLGTLRVSAGGVVPLDRGILLGRAPKVNADLPPSSRPHLVRLASQDNDISRNHAEVILEGWHVLVRDLGSTNGTTVTLPGQEPVRLRPTEDFGIEPGAVVTLADEVSLTYEVAE
jgi:hypothetical protein